MPDNVAVTVSGIKGTSHYRLTRKSVLRIKLLILSFFIALFFVCSSVVSLVEKIKLSRHQQVLLELQSLDLNSQLDNYLSLRIRLENDISVKEEQLTLVESRLNEIENYLGGNNTELDIETRLDIAAINTAVRVAILRLIPNGPPVKGPTSSAYGMRIHPITKKRTLHKGLDFSVNTGTEIVAPADGVIEWTRKSNQGSGNFLRIIHSFGITSSYSHMKSFNVKSGQFVKKGDLIGYTGNTGITSGPHLHYEIRFVGRALDPMPFINWNIDNFETVFNNQKGIPWDFLIKTVEQQVSLALQL
ncbi:M23 family metallopeptidase [Vibrio sp. VB16]|uniref:M23 family metallopeptidase n=1 Tax=Vibrio sp. VB16 TaxID=2785746 RepID=UPI0018A1110F|nr:M23 family metallopeptidase [Vibrio sp. VB16]UGA56265.1 M23 family metallopeptidase [Vibrio sp. VB16]